MKIQLLVLTAFSIAAQAQTSYQIEANSVRAYVADNGIFFNDQADFASGYEVPIGSGNHTAYTMSFWSSGSDIDGILHTACNVYGGTGDYDLFAGPIANDYNSTYYTSTFGVAIWKISLGEINSHIANYGNIGYVVPNNIQQWPGNGNTAEGVAAQLAPYVDLNQNGIYEPALGDYPYIQGDQAVYVIMNDAADNHTQSGGESANLEIHAMFYQYAQAGDLNQTTFLNVKVFNRGTQTLNNYKFGLFMDTDLGGYSDDFIGSDSARGLAYTYNGDNFDSGGGGQPGYLDNPPAFGVKMLNDLPGTVMYYNNDMSTMGNPTTTGHYDYLMSGNWLDGSPLTDGITVKKFAFDGDPDLGTGWTESNAGNPPGDRRILMASTPSTLVPGDKFCYDFAFVYNDDAGDHLQNVTELKITADAIQTYYDNNVVPCNETYAGKSEKNSLNFSVYPNPSTGSITIQGGAFESYRILNFSGQIVSAETALNQNQTIELNLAPGSYVLELSAGDQIHFQRFEVISY